MLIALVTSCLTVYGMEGAVMTSELPRPCAEVVHGQTLKPEPDTMFVGKEVARSNEIRHPMYDIPLDAALQEHIYNECEKNGIVEYYPLILKQIKMESSFDPNATNGQYVGLMQLSRDNAEWAKSAFGYDSAYNPYCNTSAGICIMAGLLKKYGDPHKALMAYNLGEAGAQKLWNNNIYTTNYTILIISTNLTF